MRDVADRAGVSVKTVSNVVNDYPHVAAQTRDRVRRAIDDLSYVPNSSARSLRNGRSGIIALAVPELNVPYFAELAHNVVRAAREVGLTVLVDETGADPERERMVASGLRGQLIDGVVLNPLALGDAELARYTGRVPTVLIGERVDAGPADHVGIDNEQAAAEVTGHLLDSGRRRVAVVGVQRSPNGRTGHLRRVGWARAHLDRGLVPDPDLEVELTDWHRSDGADAARRVVESIPRPDALFCLNDTLALGALLALRRAGVSVPDDVAVAGFDDTEESRCCSPSLTTVAADGALLAREAVRLLCERIAGSAPQGSRRVVVGHRLLVRESTRPAAAARVADGLRSADRGRVPVPGQVRLEHPAGERVG